MKRRYGKKEAYLSFIAPAVVYGFASFSLGYLFWPYFYYVKNEVLITIAFIGIWRYTLLAYNYFRAVIYSTVVYPKIKAAIAKKSYQERFPDHIYFIIPSYKEEPWVSVEVFQSIFEELDSLPCSATLVVSTGSDYDDSVINGVFKSYPFEKKMTLILQRQQQGKRIAMGHALRAVAREFNNRIEHDVNSVTIFMDGDSYLSQGTLEKCIPVFSVMPEVGAVTTNEIAYINTKSKWYMDWFNLKFGQRHILFQSQSLSKRVLTLTGRFSLFRTKAVVTEDFIQMIENDIIVHPYHGKFRFLMGDDKSSWFNLMKNGWQMLYIPDATIYSLESRNENFLELSRSLPYRWYGNTLRNNERARKLKNIPPFIRYLLWDQIFLMWTSLVGIIGAVYLAIFVNFVYLPIYIAWVFMVRIFQMFVIVFGGHTVSIRTVPLMLYSQWLGSLTKIKAYYNLSDQTWSKSGSEVQKADNDIAPVRYRFAPLFSQYRMYFAIVLFLFAMLFTNERFVIMPDQYFFGGALKADGDIYSSPPEKTPFKGLTVVADDGKDDAVLLNRLIREAEDNATIELPHGVLDLYEPIVITRSNITLHGNGTVFVSHLHHHEEAVIAVKGARRKLVGYTKEAFYGRQEVEVELNIPLRAGDLILVEQPNERNFIEKKLGSRHWYKQYPVVRSEIMEVSAYTAPLLRVAETSYSDLDTNASVVLLAPVENVHLSGFELRSDFSTKHLMYEYQNVDESRMIDGIKFLYTRGCSLENISILDSGSNPLVFERSYNDSGRYIIIDGALNKGKLGNGYLRFNKTFRCRLEDVEVRNIRHIVFQWSSAYNSMKNVFSVETDINFHGGGSHHNRVENIRFDLEPELHKWGEVYRTPTDASWAPPDYDNNVVLYESRSQKD